MRSQVPGAEPQSNETWGLILPRGLRDLILVSKFDADPGGPHAATVGLEYVSR